MRQSGRKSSASLAIAAPIAGRGRRPPPAHFNAAQAEEWTKIVEQMPADWFDADLAMLERLCLHLVTGRLMSERLTKALESNAKQTTIDKLLCSQDRETRGISALMRAMRLTKQSRWQANVAQRKVDASIDEPVALPWESHG